jgi:uncharacterized membrane protein YdjX (TVP38/TMEM64 family)
MRLLWIFLGLAALVLSVWLIWGGAWESRFTLEGSVLWIQGAGAWAWAAGIGLLLGDLILPVPSTVVISALGFVYGTVLGGLIATVGLVSAGLAGYGVGRLCGERCARRWLGDLDFEKGRIIFSAGGGWMVALSRALPILPEVISCTAGLVRMPFRKFALSLVCGSLPMGFLFSAIGEAGHNTPGWAVASSVMIPAALWAVASRWSR